MKIVIIVFTLFGVCVCYFGSKTKTEYIKKNIDKEALIGKRFSKGASFGASSFHFEDRNHVIFTIYDKRSFGYKGTYSLSQDNQSIKIQKKEKFGAPYMLEHINLEEEIVLKITGKNELNGYKLNERK